MHRSKSTYIITIIFIFCSILAFTNFNAKDKSIEEKLKIGVSDDTSGFVINYMHKKNYLKNVEMENFIEKYSILDC